MRLTPFTVAVAFLVFGVVVGSASDERPHRPPLERGGWRVLAVDFHVHTRFSDGFLSPVDLVIQGKRRGLDAMAVTEHNTVFPAYVARWYSELVGGPRILIGQEVTTREFHIIGVGLERTVPWDQSGAAIIEDIQGQGGVAIAAHPGRHFWPALEPLRGRFDGAEVMHPVAFQGERSSSRWRWDDMRRFYEVAVSEGHRLAPIGSSDYHFFSPLGVCRTYVFATDDSAEAILAAVRAARTVVYGPEDAVWGPPELVALLEAEPLPEEDWDYNYAGNGRWDRFGRALGWLGALGILLFRPSGPRRREPGRTQSRPG